MVEKNIEYVEKCEELIKDDTFKIPGTIHDFHTYSILKFFSRTNN